MQMAATEPPFHLPLRQAQLAELPPRDHAVLPLGQLSHRPISSHSIHSTVHPRSRSAYSPYCVAFAPLGEHPSEVGEAPCTRGTRFVPSSSTERKKRPQPAVAASGFDPFK